MNGRLAGVINLVPALVLAIAFATFAPATDWSRPELLIALAGIAVVSYRWEERLAGRANFLSAGIALALVAIWVAGPLAALAIWLIPDFVERVVQRRRALFTPGLIANVSGYGWAAIVGASIVGLASPSTIVLETLLLLAAGLAMWGANFLWTELLYGLLFEGASAQALVRFELWGVRRRMLGMLALGCCAAVLTAPLGLAALGLLAAAVILPQAAFARLTERTSAAELEEAEATSLYAAAIAGVMRLSRRECALVREASAVPTYGAPTTLRGISHELAASTYEIGTSLQSDDDHRASQARLVAARAADRFDGEDWPRGLALLLEAPLESRVLAVARAWSGLTAAKTPGLSHEEAMCLLRAKAGTELDPDIVAAAAAVVADEALVSPEPAVAPRLHSLPLPAGWARQATTAFTRRIAARA